MRVRITTSRNGEITTIRVEGRLGALEADELLEECRTANHPLRLVLAGVMSADESGLRALRSLRAEGAELTEASPYVQELLNSRDQ